MPDSPLNPAPPSESASTVKPPVVVNLDQDFTRKVSRWVALVAFTALIVYLCWLILLPFLDVLVWAIVLAIVFQPVHQRIRAKLGSRGWAAALACLLVVVTILIPLTLITLALVRDAADAAKYLQEHKTAWLESDPNTFVGRTLARIDRYVDIDRFKSQQYLADRIRAMSGIIASRTLNVVGGALGAVVQIFLVIFTLFYLFRDGEDLANASRRMLPLERWQSSDLFQRTKEVIRASVYGSLVVAAVQGALGGLAFWVLGLPSPLLWGVVMIFVSMIPVAGAFIVWVPAAIYLLATQHVTKAIILTLWGTLVIGTIDNVLRPWLVGGRTRLHELVIFFAVLGGIQLFGVLGLFAGPAVAAVAVAMFEVWQRSRATQPIQAATVTPAGASLTPVEPVPPTTLDATQAATPPFTERETPTVNDPPQDPTAP